MAPPGSALACGVLATLWASLSLSLPLPAPQTVQGCEGPRKLGDLGPVSLYKTSQLLHTFGL